MRPITRGPSPQQQDFADYRDAFPDLVARLEPSCSFCERRIATQLAVEHIQPKDENRYPGLMDRWDNFLLACVNCNSTKKDKDVRLEAFFLPDRDNTAAAFDYRPDGRVVPSKGLDHACVARKTAENTLALTGLDKGPAQIADENGKIVAIDRYAQRMEVWLMAESTRGDSAFSPTVVMRRQIVKTAQATGFFSIWMRVFEDDTVMRQMLIEGYTEGETFYGFPGTARDCFDQEAQPVSPRPNCGLQRGGKI